MSEVELAQVATDEESAADPGFEPKQLGDAAVIRSHLHQLQQHRVPLLISFPGHDERYRTTLVSLRRDYNLIAVDELVPFAGAEHLRNAGTFNVVGFHEGVRMAWTCTTGVTPGVLDGLPCYWMAVPGQMDYYQRREDFRVSVVLANLPEVAVALDEQQPELTAQLLDVSVTGCRLSFSGDYRELLKPGVEVRLGLRPSARQQLRLLADVRHLQYNELRDLSIVGFHFRAPGVGEQKALQQWVFQLQREAHRARSNRLF